MYTIYPSLFAADQLNLGFVVRELEPICAGFHVDIMDFHFVKNIALSPQTVNGLKIYTQSPLWVHLMVDSPEEYISRLNLGSGDTLSFHPLSLIERDISVSDFVYSLAAKNIRVSIALSPRDSLDVFYELSRDVLDKINHVLCMSVEPGFSGQEFDQSVFKRLIELKDFSTRLGLDYVLAVDGGVGPENIRELISAGACEFALGSALFGVEKDARVILREL